MNILAINLVGCTLVFFVAARIYLIPNLARLGPMAVLTPILLLHMTRHLGLMFLEPGATMPGLPGLFAWPAALGDLTAALLAAAALLALRRGSRATRPLLWVFNLWGAADLALAIVLSNVAGANHSMGAAYWIPALWVPALLVTHWLVFVILLRPWSAAVRSV